MPNLSPNAQLVSALFEEVAKGNGAPFWDACHDDVVWRTIGESSWSGEFAGKQTIVDEIFRPPNRVLVERATVPTCLIDGGDVVVLQARGRNLTHDGQRYDTRLYSRPLRRSVGLAQSSAHKGHSPPSKRRP